MKNFEEINGIKYEEYIFVQGVFIILRPEKGTPQKLITDSIKDLEHEINSWGEKYLGHSVAFK